MHVASTAYLSSTRKERTECQEAAMRMLVYGGQNYNKPTHLSDVFD